VLVAALLAAGCDKQVKSERMPDVNKVFMEVDTCLRGGDTNGALTLLTKALADKTYAQNRDWFYSYYLNVLLMGGRAEEAKTQYLGVIGKDEPLTRAGFNMLSSYYQAQGEEAQAAWIKQMMQEPLPPDLLAQVYAGQVRLFLGKGQIDKVAELVPVCISKFDVGASRRILGDAVGAEMAAERYDNASKLLDAIGKNAGSAQALKDLVAIDRTDILFLKGDWAAADPQFIKVATSLSDGELAGWVPRVIGRCIAKDQLDLADKLCDFVLKTQTGKVGTQNQAAARWMDVAKARKDVAMIPARLEALKDLAIPGQVLLSLYGNEFYTVMGENKKANIVAMMAFGDKLEALLPKADDKAQVRAMALDGSSIIEDYARSLKILELGIADRDKNWHEMAINKAKAHLALQEGKYKEAVEYFRKFMVSIGTWEKPEQDPITGILCSKEMCLGRNAKRIGDIWTKGGDAKAAADAYAEAKAFYEKALADVKADSKEAQTIKTEMGEIPAAK